MHNVFQAQRENRVFCKSCTVSEVGCQTKKGAFLHYHSKSGLIDVINIQ